MAPLLQYSLDKAKKEGLKKGRQEGLQTGMEKGRQEGLQTGMEKGRQEGLQTGMEKGRQEGQKELISKLLESGVNLQVLSKGTGLSEAEIKKLKNGD